MMIRSKVKLPTLISISAYIKGDKTEVPDAVDPDEPAKIFESLLNKLQGKKEDENLMTLSSGKDDWYIKLLDQPDYCVFTVMVSPKDDDYISDDWSLDIMKYIQDHIIF